MLGSNTIHNLVQQWRVLRLKQRAKQSVKQSAHPTRHSPLPASLLRYIKHIEHLPGGQTPLEQVRFVVLDAESTGLNARQDSILSLAAVAVEANAIKFDDVFEALVFSTCIEGIVATTGIHEILPSHLLHGRAEECVVADFADYVGASILVGHHADFDVALLNRALQRHYGVRLINPVIDTAWLAVHILREWSAELSSEVIHYGNYTLDALCTRFGIEESDRHSAAGDAFATALLFLKLLALCRKRGMSTLTSVLKAR
jgi:DNA polymerase-3 subunit epsilon